MLTALNSAEDMQKGFDSGAFDFIRKPFNKIELLARVRAAVRFASMNKILLNLEKINTFSATVKKTNHEIKQPLTLINLSVTALKRELTATDFKKDAALKRVEFIENAAIEIIKIMQTMLSIDKIELNDYIESLKNYEFKLDVEAEEILE
jgi:two-component system cell cycle response regulator